MEKVEFYSLESLNAAKEVAKTAGYQETQSIENVPVGACVANTVTKATGNVISPIFSLIKFTRTNDKGEVLNLMFEAVRLNVLHVSTGKKFNDIDAKINDNLKKVLSVPENYSKELIFNSEGYVDGQKRQRTILKFESISK